MFRVSKEALQFLHTHRKIILEANDGDSLCVLDQGN
jgi:hypothetical protein